MISRHTRAVVLSAFLLMLLPMVVAATTYHTITIDGTNDFASDEDLPGTSGSIWYFTWDANNFYFGITASDVGSNSSQKWVMLYIDTDPQSTPTSGNGTSTGVLYNTQQPGLPFNADYHFRWKADNTYTNMLDWNGLTNSWTDDNTGSNNFGISASQSGTYLEVSIPRASLGNPAAIRVAGAMINEQPFNEYTFFMVPNTNSEGYDANFTQYCSFVLTAGRSPDADCSQVLAVELAAFTATAQSDHVLVAWETVSEMETLGFNLYRSTDPATAGERLNDTLIPAAASGSSQGASYEWSDEAVVEGTTYHYWLEDVSDTGATTMHGPASVTFGVPTAVTLGDLDAGRGMPALPLLAGLALAGLGGAMLWRRRG